MFTGIIFLVFIGGSKLWLILLVLVAFSWPGLTIMVRTMVLQLKTGLEVESAKALGASGFRVVARHILPHAASYVLAQLVFFAPSAILAEAGLSFLGLGVPPPAPAWGSMAADGRIHMFESWCICAWPGLAILFVVLSCNLLGDWLRVRLDPKFRQL